MTKLIFSLLAFLIMPILALSMVLIMYWMLMIQLTESAQIVAIWIAFIIGIPMGMISVNHIDSL
jgi:putative flippase GtrA